MVDNANECQYSLNEKNDESVSQENYISLGHREGEQNFICPEAK